MGAGDGGSDGGVKFEGFYADPSLGHLVGLVRYYVHRMECVSKEEVGESSGHALELLLYLGCAGRTRRHMCLMFWK